MSDPITWGDYFAYRLLAGLLCGAAALFYGVWAIWLSPKTRRHRSKRWEIG